MVPTSSLDEVEIKEFHLIQVAGRQHGRCIVPQAVTHSLVLLRMGEIYRLKHVELIGIIIKPLLFHLVGCLYYCISDARSNKHQGKFHLNSRGVICGNRS